MQHSNCYSNVKNMDDTITSASLNTKAFDGKTGFRLQVAFFLFYRNFHSSPPLFLTRPLLNDFN